MNLSSPVIVVTVKTMTTFPPTQQVRIDEQPYDLVGCSFTASASATCCNID